MKKHFIWRSLPDYWHVLKDSICIGDVFYLIFPIIWIVIVEEVQGIENSPWETILLGLGGILASLYSRIRELSTIYKTRISMLQRLKARLNNEMVLINHHERSLLGSLMAGFIKQPGRINNSTNNLEELCLYVMTEKMKCMLEAISVRE